MKPGIESWLAPNLLIGMLQQKAESYKSDIKSSKAS